MSTNPRPKLIEAQHQRSMEGAFIQAEAELLPEVYELDADAEVLSGAAQRLCAVLKVGTRTLRPGTSPGAITEAVAAIRLILERTPPLTVYARAQVLGDNQAFLEDHTDVLP